MFLVRAQRGNMSVNGESRLRLKHLSLPLDAVAEEVITRALGSLSHQFPVFEEGPMLCGICVPRVEQSTTEDEVAAHIPLSHQPVDSHVKRQVRLPWNSAVSVVLLCCGAFSALPACRYAESSSLVSFPFPVLAKDWC